MFIEKLKAYKKGKKQFLFSSLPTKRPKKNMEILDKSGISAEFDPEIE